MPKYTKNKKKSKKKRAEIPKNSILLITFIIIAIILIVSICNKSNKQEETPEELSYKSEVLENVESQTANISKYIVYGTHFNLEGTLNINDSAIDKVKVIIKSRNNQDISYNTKYSIKNSELKFTTGETINEGIDLESFDIASYYLLLKVIYSNGEEKYYSFANSTNYGNIEYYTITKNDTNNKIYINFGKYNEASYLEFHVSKVDKLPDNVYDVVIDPGHGGLDSGAVKGNYYESNIVLNCAKQLKTKLENLGLKVFLTRDGTEDANTNMAYNMYDDDGRITTAMESHGKIFISLHLNSNEEYLANGGVEVYCPSNINFGFAKLLADNIVNMANTNYSYLSVYKVKNGVYVHNFSKSDIEKAREIALNAGYKPYENITTSTSYLFMLRETGGIATNAYVDGRSKAYSANKYYNSNVGLESYLIELGYMNVEKDLNNILDNSASYMEAIANSIKTKYLD